MLEDGWERRHYAAHKFYKIPLVFFCALCYNGVCWKNTERRAVTMVQIGNEWDVLLADEFEKPYYQALRSFLKEEYRTSVIYPDSHDIFNALRCTSYSNVRCVILGQDPYHGEGQAHGLAFSVRRGVQPPPSLQNIYKEIYSDLGIDNRGAGGELLSWANQGVLLLNTVLTVRAGQAASHRGKGWETFTDNIIRLLNLREDPIVFLLWGAPAGKKVLVFLTLGGFGGTFGLADAVHLTAGDD